MLALLCLWEKELGRRREWVARHQHQLLKLQELLNVLFREIEWSNQREDKTSLWDTQKNFVCVKRQRRKMCEPMETVTRE